MAFTGRLRGGALEGQVLVGRARTSTWTAERLPDGAEFYAALPRFRAVQLSLGRDVTELHIPGAWAAAADHEPPAGGQANALAAAAGLTPIPADSVGDYGFLLALGLLRRDELVPTLVRALTAVRAGLPTADQRRFDAIFRPRGTWLVDLHAAALDAAQRRARTLSWEDARPALSAAGLLPATFPAGVAAVPLALYRLAVLRERDSTTYQGARERLNAAGGPSAQATEILLDGYRDAAVWQGQAVAFLVAAEWVDDGGHRTSPAGLMRAAWGRPDLPIPEVRPRFFGIPEAVPRVGIPGPAVRRIVIPENWTGAQWTERRGPAALLDAYRRLHLDIGNNTLLEADGAWLLTSAANEAAASPAGFLETQDEIIEDPGTVPLFAVATALHEWQHLTMERYRLGLEQGGTLRDDGTGLQVVASDLYLAEGLAGWMTEQVLGPVLQRLPIVGVGDAQDLAVLALQNPLDPHAFGLRMMRALAEAVGSPDAARDLVLAHADNPAAVASAVPAWRDEAVADRVVPTRGQRRLVPETIFTVEDGVGDVIGVRIRAAPGPSTTR